MQVQLITIDSLQDHFYESTNSLLDTAQALFKSQIITRCYYGTAGKTTYILFDERGIAGTLRDDNLTWCYSETDSVMYATLEHMILD